MEEQALKIQETVNGEDGEYTIQLSSYIVSCTLDSAGRSSSDLRGQFTRIHDVDFPRPCTLTLGN